ncbi:MULTISPECIES: response regulator FixJ [Neorhizobium]|uniref:Response regulator transcription factor FixJ n=3 Tax=Neorhizobium galegae TaxID=399 RepID=A0A6A1TUA3_NEOGA|nr:MULTISPECIES: response regulator FixJ [Neorhizobium]KAB1087124.1 response regulator transcription factor FixJ [Neorhizobium galegae]MCJ9669850.1 response regulator FixJ [Neorhizobium sp. SHOUNA12B]MCJ9746716.1 response regulator FixJ [Neorhizobium sp. SHOUNA12A]MCJ9753032.1 response regulator FixJ [Neorhizobium sp. BETTINA12A]CDN48409.1 Two component transcriptional regulator, LuxR family; putative nitrogen fixation transcriptional regulator FixJ [Neorhizobium galegae bv. orientalis str. HA
MQTGDYTIHIVDDEEPVRKSLAFMLTMNGFAVRMHETASSFLQFAPSVRNGVLVTDLRMPDMTGVELIRKLTSSRAGIPSIVITGHGDVPMAVEAMKAGAIDFIEKPFGDTVIIEAIQRAAELLSDKTLDTDDLAEVQTRLESLSDRERQVLAAVVAGLPNKSIAYDLDISPRTVEVHRANVMSKMKAKSLPQLVRMAMAAGFGPN